MELNTNTSSETSQAATLSPAVASRHCDSIVLRGAALNGPISLENGKKRVENFRLWLASIATFKSIATTT
ncbi:hypothetical protein CMQ_3341 [Grosmannia clavigera kw1407]|uniref:Uncharacterized protein n=1 Tax=Grosmannia clavigera (strain kw1407 / UAMH 11150) TaxID=655863 RepID=F0X951_GROCL|nr:uncharacterized protein CMQ_3341 [Grosmannia clavigera kw1407]EFX05272.1 hypothetical protein CMQ_3341 [Grosmannia clavigera kw1407]